MEEGFSTFVQMLSLLPKKKIEIPTKNQGSWSPTKNSTVGGVQMVRLVPDLLKVSIGKNILSSEIYYRLSIIYAMSRFHNLLATFIRCINLKEGKQKRKKEKKKLHFQSYCFYHISL